MPEFNLFNRQLNQGVRVRAGVKGGQITPEEFQAIQQQRAAANQQIRTDRQDGLGMNHRERFQNQLLLNQSSQQIRQGRWGQ